MAVNPQWTLRRRVVALCLLGATVLTFLAVGAGATAIASRDQLDRLLEHIGPMQRASTNLRVALVAQQTWARGFVLTGIESDLRNYENAIQDERTNSDAIRASESATPPIKDQLDRVGMLAGVWRATIAEPAIAAARQRDRASALAILSGPASREFDETLAAVETMQASMQAVRDESVSAVKGTSSTLLFVLIVAAILVVASGAALLVAMQRTVIGPVTHLAGQVRSVARGNYGRAITATGPPELERLARDVDVMRQRIASDLAEVEAARQQIEEANIQLEQQAAELMRSNRDLEQFAYVASHDLQEPLRKVASFCQLLQRRYAGHLDERADQYIAFAVNGAQRMQRLINDLLAFSRIGRVTTGFVEVDLNNLVTEAASRLDGLRVRASAEITWSSLPVVKGEEELLTTLFTNLIGNSLKFRRPDEPCRVHLSSHEIDGGYEISCEDNGIGIEPEFADKVFVIFQRLHPRDAYPGTGIGLAVAKKIVEYHGGQIWIDGDYRSGTAIRFTLPMAVDPTVDGDREAPRVDDESGAVEPGQIAPEVPETVAAADVAPSAHADHEKETVA
jgi:signal transduction histidine kinase